MNDQEQIGASHQTVAGDDLWCTHVPLSSNEEDQVCTYANAECETNNEHVRRVQDLEADRLHPVEVGASPFIMVACT